jgi:hypothetical protein
MGEPRGQPSWFTSSDRDTESDAPFGLRRHVRPVQIWLPIYLAPTDGNSDIARLYDPIV